MNKIYLKKIFYIIISSFIWFLIWGLINILGIINNNLLPAPHKILSNMISNNFITNFVLTIMPSTLFWVLLPWFIGVTMSCLFALISQYSNKLETFFNVIFIAGRTLPSVIAIPLFAAIWGINRTTVLSCTTFLVLCYSEPLLKESLASVNKIRKALIETVTLSKFQSIIYITLPGIANVLSAISIQSFGISLVVTIAGEMILSIPNSTGNEVSNMAWLLRFIDLYSIVIWLILNALFIIYLTELFPKLLEYPAHLKLRKLKI